jgi:RNA polymerase sigma-70 factor (ECF subfamily)
MSYNVTKALSKLELTVNLRTLQRTQELVAQAQDGDTSALDQLCGVYTERVRRIVRFRMGPELRSHLESMDLVQEALVEAVLDIDQFRYSDEGDFLRWLSRIVENTIRDNMDKAHAAKRDIRKQVPLDRVTVRADRPAREANVPVATTTPSVVLSLREDLDRLEKAMDQLKPEYRDVIVLAKIEGFTFKEIAEKLNKTPAAVAMLLSRAIVAVTNLLEKT